jgi:hypothetical protein
MALVYSLINIIKNLQFIELINISHLGKSMFFNGIFLTLWLMSV